MEFERTNGYTIKNEKSYSVGFISIRNPSSDHSILQYIEFYEGVTLNEYEYLELAEFIETLLNGKSS